MLEELECKYFNYYSKDSGGGYKIFRFIVDKKPIWANQTPDVQLPESQQIYFENLYRQQQRKEKFKRLL